MRAKCTNTIKLPAGCIRSDNDVMCSVRMVCISLFASRAKGVSFERSFGSTGVFAVEHCFATAP